MKRWLIVLGLLLLCGCVENNASFSDEELLAVFSQLGSSAGGVYVGGGYGIIDKSINPEASPNTLPCYWVDGVLHELSMPDGCTRGWVNSLVREAGRTYIIGTLDHDSGYIQALWIDNVLQPDFWTGIGNSSWSIMAVKEGTVHVIVEAAGQWYLNSNGVSQKLEEHTFGGTLLVNDNKLMWAGTVGPWDARVPYLFEMPLGGAVTKRALSMPAGATFPRATHLSVNGNDTYVSGYATIDGKDVSGYWKNSEAFTAAYSAAISVNRIDSVASGMLAGELVTVSAISTPVGASIYAGSGADVKALGGYIWNAACDFKNDTLTIAGFKDDSGSYYLQNGQKYDLSIPTGSSYAIGNSVWVD